MLHVHMSVTVLFINRLGDQFTMKNHYNINYKTWRKELLNLDISLVLYEDLLCKILSSWILEKKEFERIEHVDIFRFQFYEFKWNIIELRVQLVQICRNLPHNCRNIQIDKIDSDEFIVHTCSHNLPFAQLNYNSMWNANNSFLIKISILTF